MKDFAPIELILDDDEVQTCAVRKFPAPYLIEPAPLGVNSFRTRIHFEGADPLYSTLAFDDVVALFEDDVVAPPPPDSGDVVTLLSNPGVWHSVAGAGDAVDAVKSVDLPIPRPPAGRVFTGIRVRGRVFHGGWVPGGNIYNVVWIALNRKNHDLFLYPNILRSGKVILRYGFADADDKPKFMEPFVCKPDQWYDFECIHEFGGRVTFEIAGVDGDALVEGISDLPSDWSFEEGDVLSMDNGFTGKNPKEPRMEGWIWSDMTVELLLS